MASITVPISAEHPGPLRALNILHDLPQVADLIELCFEQTMDDEGQTYVQQMRSASKDRDFLRWASKVMESTSMPLAGYVWEEEGRIIGNVSLVYQARSGRKLAMIANVATHPGYRRRGIGRALTERAMLAAWQKGVQDIWLQVRDDNPTAIRIYEDLGFMVRARRTTYQNRSTLINGEAESREGRTAPQHTVHITRPSARHWRQQRDWLTRAHPDELAWYARWDWDKLGPGLRNQLYRLVMQYDTRQWAAVEGHALLATVTWAPSYRVPNALWLGAGSESGQGVTKALEAARRDLAYYRRVTVEYPVGELRPEIEAAGFSVYRTLLWMRATRTEAVRIQPKKEM